VLEVFAQLNSVRSGSRNPPFVGRVLLTRPLEEVSETKKSWARVLVMRKGVSSLGD